MTSTEAEALTSAAPYPATEAGRDTATDVTRFLNSRALVNQARLERKIRDHANSEIGDLSSLVCAQFAAAHLLKVLHRADPATAAAAIAEILHAWDFGESAEWAKFHLGDAGDLALITLAYAAGDAEAEGGASRD